MMNKPTRQALAVRGRSAPHHVTGKLRTAIERMIWQGDTLLLCDCTRVIARTVRPNWPDAEIGSACNG
jgi:hypothetical protein